MKYSLDETAEADIIRIAKRSGIQKVILFGSRARGTNRERSDIDLAVSGGDSQSFFMMWRKKQIRCSCLM